MASTRSKNTPGNYELEQSRQSYGRNYETYTGYKFHDQTCFAGQGLLPGRFPLQLFQNDCDVESELMGIGATNLVSPKDPQYVGPTGTPALRPLASASVIPVPSAPIMPAPLDISPSQRFHA